MSPLLLAYGVEKGSGAAGERVPFKTGDEQLLCQTHKTFSPGDRIVLFVPDLRPDAGAPPDGRHDPLRFPQGGQSPFHSRTSKVEPAGEIGRPCSTSSPSQALRARAITRPGSTLLDGQGREIVSAKENFEVSPATGRAPAAGRRQGRPRRRERGRPLCDGPPALNRGRAGGRPGPAGRGPRPGSRTCGYRRRLRPDPLPGQ